MQLVLSLFSGIGLLDIGFREAGFCVVSAGDLIFGQDIREFRGISGKFEGIIGGSPCQDFSMARRTPPTGNGLAMLAEFRRVVVECSPEWWLLENVPQVPNMEIEGYQVQRFNLNATECGSVQNRNRRFQFGTKAGFVAIVKREQSTSAVRRCVTASEGKQADRRGFADFCELQGLPRNFELTEFHTAAKYRAVGNGVNVHVSRVVAAAIWECTRRENESLFTDAKFCVCGCGRFVTGKQKSATDKCRKVLQKQRKFV
jgi:DNA (cytosine-5)-methyltransferase 1